MILQSFLEQHPVDQSLDLDDFSQKEASIVCPPVCRTDARFTRSIAVDRRWPKLSARLREFPSQDTLGTLAHHSSVVRRQAPKLARCSLQEVVRQVHPQVVHPALPFRRRVSCRPSTRLTATWVLQCRSVLMLSPAQRMTCRKDCEFTRMQH